MAKERITSADLSWLISEELSKGVKRVRLRHRVTLAVVPDEKHGWRVVVANRVRPFVSAADQRRLAEIERRLRSVYQLQV